MRRTVTGQVQEPEDDVTGVAAFQLAALVVTFVLDEAGLVCGAAFCGTKTNKRGVITGSKLLQPYTLQYVVIRFFDPGP